MSVCVVSIYSVSQWLKGISNLNFIFLDIHSLWIWCRQHEKNHSVPAFFGIRDVALTVLVLLCLLGFPGCHLSFQHYLSECQLYLEAVPAMFRLELLENIFSLLFLSTADFSQQIQKDTNSSLNTGNAAQSDCSSDARNTNVGLGNKAKTDETEYSKTENQQQRSSSPTAAHRTHLDLGHLIQGCRGFLVDVAAMEGFMKLLKEGLEGMCVVGQQEGQEAGRALPREAEAVESLGCSVTADTFGTRLQRLSKRTAEAQWRLQIISSNQGSGNGEMSEGLAFTFSLLVDLCVQDNANDNQVQLKFTNMWRET